MSGPMIHARPLKDWEKLIRRAAESFGPSLVEYGLAAVSRVAKPHPSINKQVRKIQKDSNEVVPAIRKAPVAKSDNPKMIPFLYPNLRMKYPAGRAMQK